MAQSKKLAGLVGIDEYASCAKLRNAVSDMNLLMQVLSVHHKYEVRARENSEATLAGMRSLFTELRQEAQPDDELVMYFACHGIAEADSDDSDIPRGYLIPQDARRDDHNSFLPMDELQEFLKALPCLHILLILDCCYAGSFRASTRDIGPRNQTLYKERFERYEKHPSLQVLTSAAHDEKALDQLWGRGQGGRVSGENSPFAKALCEGLRGKADRPPPTLTLGDGVILATELHLHIEDDMRALANKNYKVPTPLLWSVAGKDKGQFIFRTPGREVNLSFAADLKKETNPYLGLRAYTKEDKGRFFGRAQATQQLHETVRTQRLTVVVGASGTGKSSLVFAGLVPSLEQQQDPPWHILAPKRPGQAPLDVLASIATGLGHAGMRLADAAAAWGGDHPKVQLLLIIDQAEELITQASLDHRTQFLMQLKEAQVVEQLHIVMTLRSDFEQPFHELMSSPGSKRFLIPHLTRTELHEIIEGPADACVLYFEPPKLVGQLVDEVANAPGTLPLLSFILSQMYLVCVDKHTEDRTLRGEDYEALDGIAGALSKRADDIVGGDPECSATLERVLLRLVSISGGERARRRMPRRELESTDPTETQRATDFLKKLQEAHLVVEDGAKPGEQAVAANADAQGTHTYVEAAHDKLISGWRKIGEILNKHGDELPVLRACTLAAEAWVSNQAGARLWDDDKRLDQLQEIWKRDKLKLNARETQFLQQSLRRRRNRHLTQISLVVAIIASLSVLTVLARQAERAARRASLMAGARELVAKGQSDRAAMLLAAVDDPDKAAGWTQMAMDLTQQWLPTTTLRHEHQVSFAALSRDGTRIVTGVGGGAEGIEAVLQRKTKIYAAWVWSADGSGEPRLLSGHTLPVVSAAWSPDGKHIVTASGDKSARVWSADGELERIFTEHERAVAFADWSPDGKRIVTAADDSTARVWNADGSGKTRILGGPDGHQGPLHCAAWSPDGAHIVTAANDNTVRLWTADGAFVRVVQVHEGAVFSVAWSPDGKRVVSVSGKLARVWNVDGTGKPLELKGHDGIVSSAAWSPDGAHIVTASADNTARVWNMDGSVARIMRIHRDAVRSAVWSRDGGRIVTASYDGAVRVWNAGGPVEPLALQGHQDSVKAVAWSPDGRRVVTASEDHTARIWNADGSLDRVLQGKSGHTDKVVSAAFSPDGHHIVTVSQDKTARVWSASGPGEPQVLGGNAQAVTLAAWSRDGAYIVTAFEDHTAQVWRADGSPGRRLQGAHGHTDTLNSVAWSPDSQHIVTASADTTARIWNVNGADEPRVLAGHTGTVLSAVWSPDGAHIVTTSEDNTALLWSADGSHSRVLKDGSGSKVSVRRALWSPDGQRILTTALDASVRMWSADGSPALPVLKFNDYYLYGIAWSPDSRHFVATFFDESQRGTGRVWSVDGSLEWVFSTNGVTTSIALDVAWSPDGQQIITANDDHTARIWRFAGSHILQEALRAGTTDCLTIQERQTYLVETESAARAAYASCQLAHGRPSASGQSRAP